MRLYLSSFRMGDNPEYLTALAGDPGGRAVVIANALDDAPDEVRRAGLERELAALGALGFAAAELDLRDYFGPGGQWPGRDPARAARGRVAAGDDLREPGHGARVAARCAQCGK